MLCRARRPRRTPRTILLAAVFAAALLAPATRARAANDPLDTLAGPPSSRFTWVPTAVPLGPVVDAEWALFHMRRALWDPVDPKQIGSLTDSLQYRVNGEVYRFANEKNLRRFMHSPALWCGLVRDPVTGNRFLPSVKSPTAYWIGGPYMFETEANKQAFVDDPHKYEVIRRM